MDDKTKNTSTIAGVIFVGCMMIGLGLGILYNKTAVGILLGMGIGFIAMGGVWALFRQK